TDRDQNPSVSPGLHALGPGKTSEGIPAPRPPAVRAFHRRSAAAPSDTMPKSRGGGSMRWLAATVIAAAAAATGIATASILSSRASVVAISLVGMVVSLPLAVGVHRFIEARRPQLGSMVVTLLGRANAVEDLSKSLALDVDRLLEACRELDQQILAKTFA